MGKYLCPITYASYPSGSVTDPTGPRAGSYRVNRGGSFYNTAYNARSAYRDYNDPSIRFYNLGFRACSLP